MFDQYEFIQSDENGFSKVEKFKPRSKQIIGKIKMNLKQNSKNEEVGLIVKRVYIVINYYNSQSVITRLHQEEKKIPTPPPEPDSTTSKIDNSSSDEEANLIEAL